MKDKNGPPIKGKMSDAPLIDHAELKTMGYRVRKTASGKFKIQQWFRNSIFLRLFFRDSGTWRDLSDQYNTMSEAEIYIKAIIPRKVEPDHDFNNRTYPPPPTDDDTKKPDAPPFKPREL